MTNILNVTVAEEIAAAQVIKKINFQPDSATLPAGYTKDIGEAYSDARGYGWVKEGTSTPLDIKLNSRDRDRTSIDQRLDTLIHMQGNTVPNFNGVREPAAWECALPNGIYSVTVSVGDQPTYNSKHTIRVQKVVVINQFQSSQPQEYQLATSDPVNVTNGKLTVDAIGGINTKINYIEIESISPGSHPRVTSTSLESNATGIFRDTAISLTISQGVDETTLEGNVQLYRTSTNTPVSGVVNTSGGGDIIVFQPGRLLDISTNYTLRVTQGVKDESAITFFPYSTTFTTGTSIKPVTAGVKFLKTVVFSGASLSSLVIGPDNKLYAAALDGKLRRWTMDSSGNLMNLETLALPQIAGRAIIGICFEPNQPNILWLSHNNPVAKSCDNRANDFTGKISKLTLSGSGFNASIQDYIVGLPRSGKDHLSNSIAFGPDSKLYLSQGSNTAMGAVDTKWCDRPERLLSATVLQINPTLTTGLPINVQTEKYVIERGPNQGQTTTGNYNPSAPNAPVKIYATGIRNAYDLVWHSNGKLYAPTNGSAAGGNTPDSPSGVMPVVPALKNVFTQNDYLFKVEQGGYYGHPNPLRQQYVMNGGNPTNGIDPAEVVPKGSYAGYTVGIKPDVNYKGFAWDFGLNRSPNGVIEYKSNNFSGALQQQLLVVEYSGGDDILALKLGIDGNVVSSKKILIEPNEGFLNPLDLVENTQNGNLYIVELINENGQGQISLLRPA